MKGLCLVILALSGLSIHAQLSGNISIPGDYPDLSSAITALNTWGPGSGGVTFNVLAPQTTPPNGYVITATGNLSSPVIFQGNGNNVFAAGTTAAYDGIFKLEGCDYMTINNFILTGTASVEWGVALLKRKVVDVMDGCQHNTFSHLTITLNKSNVKSIGFYGANHASNTTDVLPFPPPGNFANESNSFNQFKSNNISNVYKGIELTERSNNANDMENDIGGPNEGNIISNFGGSTGIAYGIHLESFSGVKISDNTITLSPEVTGPVTGIYTIFGEGEVRVESNTISLQSMRAVSGIDVTGTTVIARYNIVAGCSISLTGEFRGIDCTANFGGYVEYNQVKDNKPKGLNVFYIVVSGNGSGVMQVNHNLVFNNSSISASDLYGIYVSHRNATIRYNQLYADTVYSSDISRRPNMYGIYYSSSVSEVCEYNIIHDLFSSGFIYPGFCVLSGIHSVGTATYKMYSNNEVYNLKLVKDSVPGESVAGISINNGSGVYIANNKVGNISGGGWSPIVYGIEANIAGSSIIRDNRIGSLYAPDVNQDNAIRGIAISSSGPTEVYYNTVVLDALSTGDYFGSSALYVASGTPLILRNNIFINNSIPGINGHVVSYTRSSGSLDGYGQLSNHNLLYAGVPGTHNLIFSGYPETDSSLELYKSRVAPRDSWTVTENTRFTDSVITSTGFLHIDTTIHTQAESGGVVIGNGGAVDFDGDIRFGSLSYTGKGFAPDIGADEFEGIFLAGDIGIVRFNEPACINNGSAISIVLKNSGQSAISFVQRPVTIHMHITGVIDQINEKELNTGGLLPGDTMVVTIINALDISAAGTYHFNASLSQADDIDITNNTMIEQIRRGAPLGTFPQLINFDGYIGNNLGAVFAGWVEGAGMNIPLGTQSSWTDCADLGQSGNRSAKVQLAGNTANEWIISPFVVPSQAIEIKLKVAVTEHGSLTNGATMGADDKVSIMISNDCGTSWVSVKDFTAADALTPVLTEFTAYTTSYGTQKILVALRASDGQTNDPNDYDFHVDDLLLQAASFPLPIELISFSGQRTGNTNLLKWITASEQDVRGFQVERSTDGMHYDIVAFVNSKSVGGNSSVQLFYDFTDNNITGTKQYYRLRQYDMDGRNKLSNVILIRNTNSEILLLAGLYPNPVSDKLLMEIQVPYRSAIKIIVANNVGQIVKEKIAQAEKGINTIDMDVHGLIPGLYIIKISSAINEATTTGKFVKQ